MNVDTFTVSAAEAKRKLSAVRELTDRQRLDDDDKWQRLYTAVRCGARVLNLHEAFRQTGLNDNGQPKLAIARANWRRVYLHEHIAHGVACGFSDDLVWNSRATRKNVTLPTGVFATQEKKVNWGRLYSPVPYVPPDVRPAAGLGNYHVLFEVEQWMVYPHDPYLLKHIGGSLYVVLGEWDLTPLEVSLFSGS